jgi:cold shock CspA family protein
MVLDVSPVRDVFLSYNTPDRPIAERIAKVIEHQAWTVWWDRRIVPGKSYDVEIERFLNGARAVIAVWSKTAIQSDWVRAEAEAAADRSVLLPTRIDDVKLPLRFRLLQTADLSDWNPRLPHKGFEALLDAAAVLVGKSVLDFTPGRDAQGYYDQGVLYEASGHTEQATAEYARALRADPDFAPALARFKELIDVVEAAEPSKGLSIGKDIEFGSVDWFNSSKGYGFIKPEAGGAPVFVHISALERQALTRKLREGERVAYLTIQKAGRKAAQKVRVL